jgi:predicted HTH domain antitoxin
MISATIELPDHLNMDEKEVKRFLAAKLYESGKLSLGQAADLAGLSKEGFFDILQDFNVSPINYSADDVLKDVDRL